MKFRIPRSISATFAEASRVTREPPLLLWSLFLLFFPFYIFRSGLPQPADCILIVLFPMLLARWNGRLLDMTKAFKVLVAFTLYAVAINLLWSVALMTFTIDGKRGFLLSPTYYLYNLVMLGSFLLMYQRYGLRFLWITARVTLLSVCVQVVLSFFIRSHGARDALFFNKANQLGYYALLCACLLLLGLRRLQMTTLQVTVGLTACSYLALMSASKAALGSIAMLAIVLMVSRLRTMIVAILVLAVLALTPNPFSHALQRAEDRIENDESHGMIEERGYDRVLKHREYWVFGAGEGDYVRFVDDASVIGSHELHSSAATLLFSYGFIGVFLFAAFMWLALRGGSARSLLVVGSGFAYGMVHQGIRFTLFWVMIGMAMAICHLERQERRERRDAMLTSRSGLARSSA